MFEHSVKVPRPYKLAANIFKKVSTEGGSVKTLLYDDKLRHFRTNALYALITETIKHSSLIDKLFANCNLLDNEPRLDPWLAKVLAAELLFGKKALPGNSKPELTIASYKEKFEQYTAENPDDVKIEAVRRPRYVRINTNLLTTSDAVRAFQDEDYRFVRCTSGSYNDYLQQIQNLGEYDFTQDYHVKTVYVFPPGTKMHNHQLYWENKIILQDKATTMAVHLLAPPQGSIVLDMCAAPGMKTTQLAAYMRNEGKIYAVERNAERYATLCEFVEKTGCKGVQTIHRDSLEIKRGEFDDVEYILLDPSCSGSGMDFSVHNYIEATRLAKLTSLQEKFLKHAMNSFPNAKRIVYSTCSIYPEENERVVTNTVKVSRAKWRVQDVKELLKDQWNNFGSNMYGSIGVRCMYAKSDSDMTTGFFLAVLDRDQKDMEKQNEYLEQKRRANDEIVAVTEKERKSRKSKNTKVENEIEEAGEEDNEVPDKVTKKKKKNCITDDANSEIKENNCVTEDKEVGNNANKKKKKRKQDKVEESPDEVIETIAVIESMGDEEQNTKKKKKKRKNHEPVEVEDGTVNNEIDTVPKTMKNKHRAEPSEDV